MEFVIIRVNSYFGRQGQGPGEFLELQNINIQNNDIYILDRGNNKVVILTLDNHMLKYKDEFRLNNVISFNLCLIGDDRILIACQCETENVALFDKEGNLINKFSINSIKNIKTDTDFYAMTNYIERGGENDVLIGNRVSGELSFCKFDRSSDSLIVNKKTRVKSKFKGNIEFDYERNAVIMTGIGSITSSNEFYFVLLPASNSVDKSVFEVYDKDGEYIGNCSLLSSGQNIELSSDADTLWFMDIENDTTIYVAERE